MLFVFKNPLLVENFIQNMMFLLVILFLIVQCIVFWVIEMNFVYVFSCIGLIVYVLYVCLFFLFYCTCTTFVVNKHKH